MRSVLGLLMAAFALATPARADALKRRVAVPPKIAPKTEADRDRTEGDRPRWGFQAGVNFTGYALDPPDPNSRMRVAFTGGVQGELPVSGSFSFEGALLLTQKGYNTDNGASGAARVDGTLNLTMIEVPLLAKLRILEGAPMMPFFVLGPDFMFRIGGSISGTDPNGNSVPVAPLDTYQYGVFALGLDLGAGLEFRIDPETRAFALLRGTYGLTNETSVPLSSREYRGLQLVGGMNFAL